jgi:hypothetical protein
MSNEPTSGPAERGLPIDIEGLGDRVRRVLSFDESVYSEIAASEDRVTPFVVVVVSTLLAAIGGWLWLILEFDGLSTSRILVRELLLGSVFALALWGVWVYLASLYLRMRFAVEIPLTTLAGTMGYAAAPWGLTLLMLIPALSFGIGLLALTAWAFASREALRAAAAIDARQATGATLAGFAPLVLVLGLLADQAGMAPGVFVHAASPFEYLDINALAESLFS